jgi:hypothetical protein
MVFTIFFNFLKLSLLKLIVETYYFYKFIYNNIIYIMIRTISQSKILKIQKNKNMIIITTGDILSFSFLYIINKFINYTTLQKKNFFIKL